MAAKNGKPEQANWLTPYLWVPDVDEALKLYAEAFGFEPGMTLPGGDSRTTHGEMSYQGRLVLMLGAEGAMGSPLRSPQTSGNACPVGLYVYCPDVDGLAIRAMGAGVALVEPVQDMFWGDRIASLRDPFGYAWTFATNVGEFDPKNVPEL
ncbi:VOC family protein [Marinobacterium arenosum]|uniref:VOC family protein n=1 Tax=Marinobacterium arenosum TaxID=2862496 RepID=UPI001C96E167|nr:VOC family protein [Marinobacterium arenosum]MBY4675307.1 VOC family protein [Marinobacterium arenosum]